jgi:hypothetical protein
MEISEYTEQKTQFLKADDLQIGNIWKITGEGEMMVDGFGNNKLHIPLECNDSQKLFSCNKTNARTIQESLGKETKKWIGREMKIGTYKSKIDGNMRDVLSVDEIVAN